MSAKAIAGRACDKREWNIDISKYKSKREFHTYLKYIVSNIDEGESGGGRIAEELTAQSLPLSIRQEKGFISMGGLVSMRGLWDKLEGGC